MQMALNDWSNLENTDLGIQWKGTGKVIQDIERWDFPWPYISQSERLASLLTLQLVASSISDQSNVFVIRPKKETLESGNFVYSGEQFAMLLVQLILCIKIET